MEDQRYPVPSSEQAHSAFQKTASEVIAQRIEGLALELRGMCRTHSGTIASTETLSALAVTLRIVLSKIDEIFEIEGFVFTPGCLIMLDLFQARARGSLVSASGLSQSLGCHVSICRRWLNLLEKHNLVTIYVASNRSQKFGMTERGFHKTSQALQLLL